MVRVHTDARAAQLAARFQATAVTVGSDIVFGAGAYVPGTPAGDLLLAHELAHVAQQHGGAHEPESGNGSAAALERDADRVAFRAALRGVARMDEALAPAADQVPRQSTGLRLQRCPQKKKKPKNIPDPKKFTTFEAWLRAFPGYGGDKDITDRAPADLKNMIAGGLGIPPDCADVSLLLRHYYLKAHGKKLTFKAGPGKGTSFTIGKGVSDKDIRQCMIDLGSINFQEDRKGFRLVAWYKKSGKRITNLKELVAAGLKPGDVLVWKRQPGVSGNFEGHVQTVQEVDLPGKKLTMVQGNMSSGSGVGQLQHRQLTFRELTGKSDGDAPIKPRSGETFYGAGPWNT